MSIQRTMIFVDGENLVMRYQAMLESGKKPAPKVVRIPDVLVWHPLLTSLACFDLIRVSYYTSSVGDDSRIGDLKRQIAAVSYAYDYIPLQKWKKYLDIS